MEKFKSGLLNFLLALIFGIPTALLGGLITKDMWRWFVAPVLHLPDITYTQGVGLNVAVTWFSFSITWYLAQRTTDTSPEVPQWGKTLLTAALYLFIWAVAWCWATALHLS